MLLVSVLLDVNGLACSPCSFDGLLWFLTPNHSFLKSVHAAARVEVLGASG